MSVATLIDLWYMTQTTQAISTGDLPMSSQCPHRKGLTPTVSDFGRTQSADRAGSENDRARIAVAQGCTA